MTAVQVGATDPNSGLPWTAMDPNNQTVTYKTYDPRGRPTEIDYPDGGKLTGSWDPSSAGFNRYMNSSTFANFDYGLAAYGRLNWVAVQNGAGGYYWNNYWRDGAELRLRL